MDVAGRSEVRRFVGLFQSLNSEVRSDRRQTQYFLCYMRCRPQFGGMEPLFYYASVIGYEKKITREDPARIWHGFS